MSRNNTNAQKDKARNDGLSAQMTRRAKRTRCPKCERGNALKRIDHLGYLGWQCRYCDYERGAIV